MIPIRYGCVTKMQLSQHNLEEKIWHTFGHWVLSWLPLPWLMIIVHKTPKLLGLKIHLVGSFFMQCNYITSSSFVEVNLTKQLDIVCYSIDHYVKLRDIQTVAMLCCAFGYKCESQDVFRRKTTRSESGSVSVKLFHIV